MHSIVNVEHDPIVEGEEKVERFEKKKRGKCLV